MKIETTLEDLEETRDALVAGASRRLEDRDLQGARGGALPPSSGVAGASRRLEDRDTTCVSDGGAGPDVAGASRRLEDRDLGTWPDARSLRVRSQGHLGAVKIETPRRPGRRAHSRPRSQGHLGAVKIETTFPASSASSKPHVAGASRRREDRDRKMSRFGPPALLVAGASRRREDRDALAGRVTGRACGVAGASRRREDRDGRSPVSYSRRTKSQGHLGAVKIETCGTISVDTCRVAGASRRREDRGRPGLRGRTRAAPRRRGISAP